MQYDVSFGRIGKATKAEPGTAFRLALLGDFSGRANKGILETGDALAKRKPIKIDVDNLDNVIERMNLQVNVPVDEEGAVISAPIKSMDDFHPDQLVENLELFEELLSLRRNLQSKTGFDRAAKEVLSWSGEEALPPPARKSAGAAVATDRKLSDFARLTGRKSKGEVIEADVSDLIKRIIGSSIEPARDSRQDALVARVDAAISAAMRRVLHHPDFQTAEALWRGVELLVRRIETDARLQIVLYDISAEELAADLAASDALDKSGLFSLLVEQPAMDANQGALSLLAGLYQWELTPPHADLLGRVAQVAAAAGAPFVSSISPDPLKEPMHEWHPLIKSAWEQLQGLSASAYLGLATPRFLMRMPYGKKTDPIDSFAFEEFTRQSGLSGMLWGNPAVLTALCVAESWKRGGKGMKLGSIATVDDMPVFVYTDPDGDQIALPCTERHYSERLAAQVASTKVNPVVSMRGRPEVRVGGFRSLAGPDIAGRWAPADVSAPAAPAAAKPAAAPAAKPAEDAPPPDTSELDALLASLDTPAEAAPEPAAAAPEPEPAAAEEPEEDLDALLASLNAPPPEVAEDETEPDLDALLASLK